MKLKIAVLVTLLIAISPLFLVLFQQPILSTPPSSVKDTVSNPQLSTFARILAVTQGQSVLTLGYSAPTLSANNLNVGDTIGIGTTGVSVGISGPLTLYTVKDIGAGVTNVIELNAGVGQSNAWVGAAVVSTQSAIHTLTFTPTSNFTGGFWQFLFKASNRAGETNADGIPDQQGFDLGQDVGAMTTGIGTRLKAADVACPNFATGVGNTWAYGIGTTVYNGNLYAFITCSLGAGNTNAIGVGYSAVIGRDLTVGSQLINPSPRDPTTGGHIEGTADTYTFYVRHLYSTAAPEEADTVQGKVGLLETVRVSATVDPTLSFIIDTTGIGATACGQTLKANQANVTATAVPFGSLNLNAFNDLAQRLSVTTNAGAYVVTAYESSPLRSVSDTSLGATIPDTNCDPGKLCNVTTYNSWNTDVGSSGESGFGYSLQNVNVGTTIFNFNTLGIGPSWTSKPFGTTANNAQPIMSHPAGTAITQTESAFVCYRATASVSQVVGNYENEVVYTATSTF